MFVAEEICRTRPSVFFTASVITTTLTAWQYRYVSFAINYGEWRYRTVWNLSSNLKLKNVMIRFKVCIITAVASFPKFVN